MNTLALVLSIVGGGGLIGLLSTIVKICMDYQKLKSAKEQMENAIQGQKTKTNALVSDFNLIHSDFMQMKLRIDENAKRDAEEREKSARKFDELYNSRNSTNETLIKLTTTVESLVATMSDKFETINFKIDEIKSDLRELQNDCKR